VRWLSLFLGGLLCLFVGCRSADQAEPQSASGAAAGGEVQADPSWCASDEALDARQHFIETAALNTWRTDWEGGVTLGESKSGDGFSMRAVRWDHPRTGDQAFGLWLEPSPRPAGPLPLLVNVHGHWDAGIEAGEVLFRSELFARQGWAVLSVATRGAEQGDAAPLPWRTAHFDVGLYGEMRERAFGSTPLAWNVEAAHRGLDLALEGAFSSGPMDRDRVGLIGASGGAEIAALLGTVESRIGAVVLAAYEYAFGSQSGGSSCSCGVLAGGGDGAQTALWLALGACRFGRKSVARPTLLWDAQPDSGRSAALLGHGLATSLRVVPGVHGFTPPMAAASWAWMERALGGVYGSDVPGAAQTGPSTGDEDAARTATRGAWQHVPVRLRPTWSGGMLGVGRVPGTKAPWETPFATELTNIRTTLGLGTESAPTDPGEGWAEPLEPAAIEVQRSRVTPDGSGWVVVVGQGPTELGSTPSFSASAAHLDGLPLAHLRGLTGGAALALLTPRGEVSPAAEPVLTRWGIEEGKSPLGLSVHDVLTAHAQLAALPEVDPNKVGFIGIGSGGPAALWAARLLGGDSPVFLVHAPATLWWDGPRSPAKAEGGGAASAPLRPWPTTLLVAGRFGASTDPWMALAALAPRLRWLDPRAGDGSRFSGPAGLPGVVVETLSEGLAD
jgi:cephalosporin-C deacetylase-like acetyl esterase